MIARVGIVAKAHLQAAGPHLTEIAAWLRARDVEPVFDHDTAALAPGATDVIKADKNQLPGLVDLVLVLGGDGTLLGMADRIGQTGADIPILGVNFGGLGFLTEVTLPELYPTLEATLKGTAQTDERMTLRAVTLRGEVPFDDRVVLNDVVLTQGTNIVRGDRLFVNLATKEGRVEGGRVQTLITPAGGTGGQ